MSELIARTLKLLAPVLTASFAVFAAYASDDTSKRRRNRRVAAAGAVVLALVSVVLELSDQIGRERDAADELRRQRNLLLEIRRSAFAIDSIDVDLQYVFGADRPSFATLITTFDKFIRANQPPRYTVSLPRASFNDYALAIIHGTKTYSFHDGATKLMVVPDEQGVARVMELAVSPGSPLYPRRGSPEFQMLRPSMHLLFFASHQERVRANLAGPIIPNARNAELTLELPLDREIGEARIAYRPVERWLYVLPTVKAAEAVHDPGAIMSVLDFGRRKAVLLLTPWDYGAINVVAVTLTLHRGDAPSWGRTRTFSAPDLRMINREGRAVAVFGIKPGDFETAQGPLNASSD